MIAASHSQYSFSTPQPTRARAHGFDRIVVRVSKAMLSWAATRAHRLAVTDEAHARRLDMANMIEARDHQFALLAARGR